jgi:capsular polysaccharide biosynthesis protein
MTAADGAFRLRFLELGDGRLALTSPFRRPARLRPAAEAAAAFHPLPAGGGVALFEEACLFGDGALMGPQGDLVAETAPALPAPGGALRREDEGYSLRIRPLTRIRRLNGDYIDLRGPGDCDYAHWLIEQLPRVAIAAQFCDLSRFSVLAPHAVGAMEAVVRDSLGLFGIAPGRIETPGPGPAFVQRLVLPLSSGPASPDAIEVLESFPLRVASRPDASRKIFAAQGDADDALAALLRRRGFVAIEAGKLSFAERIGVFSQAEIIVATEASALADVAFAPPGVKAIALGRAGDVAGLIGALCAGKKGRFLAPDPADLDKALDSAGA